MLKNINRQKRKRGVILTSIGLKKLLAAKSEVEHRENNGSRFTLEIMSERTHLAVDTLTKIFGGEIAVDKRSLKRCFEAFGLMLTLNDYFGPTFKTNSFNSLAEEFGRYQVKEVKLERPGGPVPLESRFYVKRLSFELNYHEIIRQPEALIQIAAAKQMGKTSLMTRILHQFQQEGYYTVILNFRLPDTGIYAHREKFLQHFCAEISTSLGLPVQFAEYWNKTLCCNYNATHYLEQGLLAKIDRPLVLAIDEINEICQYPEIANDFFRLLRSWYEKTQYSYNHENIWQQLRMLVVHSNEVDNHKNNYPLSEVGLSINLPEFTNRQVHDLARQHGLYWSIEQVNQLMAILGSGNPHQIRLALYNVSHT